MLLLALLFWVTENKPNREDDRSTVGRELSLANRILIPARHRAEMHEFTPYLQGDRAPFRYVHTTDRVAHQPMRTNSWARLRWGGRGPVQWLSPYVSETAGTPEQPRPPRDVAARRSRTVSLAKAKIA
jgi:hypothetical protein